MISTKGRYALRVMLDLAEHADEGCIPLKDVAARQNISLKYLERILPTLTKAKLIEGVHGKGGGYRLTRDPSDYTVGEVLRLTEGDLAPVSCLSPDAAPCDRVTECRTIKIWRDFYDLTNKYFDGIRLSDLTAADGADNYVI